MTSRKLTDKLPEIESHVRAILAKHGVTETDDLGSLTDFADDEVADAVAALVLIRRIQKAIAEDEELELVASLAFEIGRLAFRLGMEPDDLSAEDNEVLDT